MGDQLNLALLKSASASTPYSHPAFPVSLINDGYYDNCRSWIAADGSANNNTVLLNLGGVFEIRGIALTSLYRPMLRENRTPFTDRSPTRVNVYVGRSEQDRQLVSARIPDGSNAILNSRVYWNLNADVVGQFVWVEILATSDGFPPRIDEVEVYGSYRVGGGR
jgi:hypothetical protein